ncbi:MAG: tetratricopeptide repeat protein [Synergistaceae bacterium]|nr:tetratricopeptide repeat protein [Synergistaceae bacterium]
MKNKLMVCLAVMFALCASAASADNLGVAMRRYERFYQEDMKANKYLTEDEIFALKQDSFNAASYMPLASCYYGQEKYNESFPYYLKAAEKGSMQGALMLAISYIQGHGTDIKPTEGAKWMLVSANGGNPMAQYFMGHIYKEGAGVERSQTEADKWFASAAGKGVQESTLGTKGGYSAYAASYSEQPLAATDSSQAEGFAGLLANVLTAVLDPNGRLTGKVENGGGYSSGPTAAPSDPRPSTVDSSAMSPSGSAASSPSGAAVTTSASESAPSQTTAAAGGRSSAPVRTSGGSVKASGSKATAKPIIKPKYDPDVDGIPECLAIINYLDKNYGTKELILKKFGKPRKTTIRDVKGYPNFDAWGQVVRLTTYDYNGFTVRIGVAAKNGKSVGTPWLSKLIVTAPCKITFNGVNIGSSVDDLLAVAGKNWERLSDGEGLDVESHIKFKITDDRVSYMHFERTVW